MIKVIKAELKKLVSRAGIYILVSMLAIILVLGVFIYKPTVYEDKNITLYGSNVTEKYDSFMGNGISGAGLKSECDEKVEKAKQSILSYTLEDNLSYKIKLENQKLELSNAVDEYSNLYFSSTASVNTKETARQHIIECLENINYTINSALNLHNVNSYPIVTTTKNYEKYNYYYDRIKENFTDVNNISDVTAKFENDLKFEFFNTISNFKYVSLDKDFVEDYTSNSKYETIINRLNKIYEQMVDLKNDSDENNPEKIKKIDELANYYRSNADLFVNLIKDELILKVFDKTSTSEEMDLLYLNLYSEINIKTDLLISRYLFNNNKIETDYAKPLTINVTSNSEINTYDYTHFTLKLFSFILIIYCVMTVCSSIAGEMKDGTIRLFSIRPISRSNIILGKIFAVLIMALILSIFSTVIALIVGASVYGIKTNLILTIFNGTNLIIIHPILMILIYMFGILIETTIYVLIASLLSVLIKSDLLCFTLTIILFLANFLLPAFVGGMNSWLAFYPFAHISIYALFGSSIYTREDILSRLLSEKIYVGSNIILTLVIILIIAVLTTLASIKVFKKREL